MRVLGKLATWTASTTGAWLELKPSAFGITDKELNDTSSRRVYLRIKSSTPFQVSYRSDGLYAASHTDLELWYAGPIYVNLGAAADVVEGY